MWHAVTILLALATPHPQAQDPSTGPIQVTAIEKGVLTIPPSADKTKVFVIKLEPVDTPAGPRVRLTWDGTTLEAARLQVRYDDRVTTIEAVDGKTYNINTERLPAPGKPAPKPKQPDR